jgi:hypothetical protein
LRPGTLGRIGGLKAGNLLLGNLKLPDNDEHRRPQSCLYGSSGGIAAAKARGNPTFSQEKRCGRLILPLDWRIEADRDTGFGGQKRRSLSDQNWTIKIKNWTIKIGPKMGTFLGP